MSSVTAPGCETVTAWDASSSTRCAFARSDMKRASSAGMARSCAASSTHDSIDVQAARVAGASNAASASGRWVTAIRSADGRVDVAGEQAVEALLVDVELGLPCCRRACGYGTGCGGAAELGPRELDDEVGEALAGLREEARDEDEGRDVRVALGGVAHDVPAVRVPGDDDRPVDAVEDAAEVLGVALEAAKRVGDRDHGVARLAQGVDRAVPARRVRVGAVDQDDGLLHGVLVGSWSCSFS